jgi:hypothetical protein
VMRRWPSFEVASERGGYWPEAASSPTKLGRIPLVAILEARDGGEDHMERGARERRRSSLVAWLTWAELARLR